MDKRWSTYVQMPEEIDFHRELRFRDRYSEQILKGIGAKAGMTIADIGCGAGTLTRKLSDWLGSESKIYGIDRDSGFIDYSREKANRLGYKNIEYINADAFDIPLPDNCLDMTTSHTVIDHVEPEGFLLEQRE